MFAEVKLVGTDELLEHPMPVTVNACEDPIVVDKSPFERRTGLLQRYPILLTQELELPPPEAEKTPRLNSAASTTAIISMAQP
jgi:hypothetical protein